MDVLTMIKHSLSPETVNPITVYFEVGRQVASAGPEMVWKVYDATRISDRKPASVFIFEKRWVDKLHKAKRREMVTEILRQEVTRLVKFKHSRLLQVIHPTEECHDSLAFASEPVFASLANLLGNHEKLPSIIPPEIKENNFLDVELKYGLLQVTNALSYLHNSQHIVHGNLCPQSILLTRTGMWKVAGLGFSVSSTHSNAKLSYPVAPWTPKLPKLAQPDLDYLAPDVQLETVSGATPASDLYSLGLLAIALYNNGRSLVLAGYNLQNYVRCIEQLPELFTDQCHCLPDLLIDPVQKMIGRDVHLRPTAQLFALLPFFDDPVVHCMQSLDALESTDLSQKCDFFNRLASSITLFPTRLLQRSVLPMLTDQLQHPEMFLFVLPSLVSLVRNTGFEDYRNHVQPYVARVFQLSRPIQATIYLLEKLDVILGKASEDDIRSDILPLLFSTLESSSVHAQEAAIAAFSTIQRYLDEDVVRRLVLPKVKVLFQRSTDVRTRLNAVACIDKLIDCLDKMTIIDELIPFLTEIQCTDVAVIMAVVGLYQHLLSDRRYGLTHNLLATRILPCLIPHSIIPSLSIEQFSALMEVLRAMLNQVDQQRRSKMMMEIPDDNALELRSNLQQMYDGCLSSGGGRNSQTLLMTEDLLAISKSSFMGKRSSQTSSNSSSGSSYSAGRVTPRTSIDFRYNTSLDSSKSLEATSILDTKCFLSVEEAYQRRYNRRSCSHYSTKQIPSAPELQTKTSSKESLEPRPYKRHSSFQGLGMEEQAALEKIVRERRCSLVPKPPRTPHILVSEVSSMSSYTEPFFLDPPRRASAHTMGPILAPISDRGDIRGRLLDVLPPFVSRRSSFQGICESAKQFFVGK